MLFPSFMVGVVRLGGWDPQEKMQTVALYEAILNVVESEPYSEP